MFQLNIPRKIVSSFQMWIGLVLAIVAVVVSLSPLLKLKMPSISDQFDVISPELGDALDVDFDIPDELEVSALDLVSSIGLVIELVDLGIDAANLEKAANSMTEQEVIDAAASMEARLEALYARLATPAGVKDFTIAAYFFVEFTELFNFDAYSDALGWVAYNLIPTIALFYILFTIILLPLACFFAALGALFSALKNIRTPENVSAKLGGKVLDVVKMSIPLLLCACVVSNIQYATALATLLYVILAGVVVNLVCTRLRDYPSLQFKYLNVVQLTSIAGIVGFFCFLSGVLKLGVFNSFANGAFPNYLVAATSLTKNGVDVNNGYIIDGILMVVYVLIVFYSFNYIDKAIKKLTCTMKKEGTSDSSLVGAIFLLAVYFIPTYISGAKHFYINPASTAPTGDASFLELTFTQNEILSKILVGVIIMLVAEIAAIVLKKIFCSELTEANADAVLVGIARSTNELMGTQHTAPQQYTQQYAAPAPDVQYQQYAAPAPEMHEAQQSAAPAPDVHVENQQYAPAPQYPNQQYAPAPQYPNQQYAPAPQYPNQQYAPAPQYPNQQYAPAPQYPNQQYAPAPQYPNQQYAPAPDMQNQQYAPAPQYPNQQYAPAPDMQNQQYAPAPQYPNQQYAPAPDMQNQQYAPAPQYPEQQPEIPEQPAPENNDTQD